MKLSDVNPKKCPYLYAALKRGLDRQYDGWARVVELRQSGQEDAAGRLVRKLLGVQGPPMSEETKEKLRQYSEEHAEEIRERRKSEAQIRRRTLALLTTGRRVRR
jgi:hypothetical protein